MKKITTPSSLVKSFLSKPQDTKWYYEQEISKAREENFEETIKCFDKTIARNPAHDMAWLDTCRKYLELEHSKEALANFNQAIKLDHRRHERWQFRGVGKYYLDSKNKYLSQVQRFYFLAGFLLINICSIAQTSSAIEWQKCLGGSGQDYGKSIKQTPDGGYIVAGVANSDDGDVSGSHGGDDCWIVKLNSSGAIQWQKTFGGSDYDHAYSIDLTTDGGYIVAGGASSNDGDVSGNHGGGDYWILKLNGDGTIQWQKCLGGSSGDVAHSIIQTSDGGYIVAGESYSNDGDVSGNHGDVDYWIVKLNSSGTIQWQKCLGGSGGDAAYSIDLTTDGGYIVAGESHSDDGDVSGSYGYGDCWIVKLDSNGLIQWQKCLSGFSENRDAAYSIDLTTDGGYIVAGETSELIRPSNHSDYLIVKLNSSGDLQWQKILNRGPSNIAYSAKHTSDGGCIVAGYTDPWAGDGTDNRYPPQYWILRLNSSGDVQWEQLLGGNGSEIPRSIEQTSDGGYIVAGYADSNDGDVSGNHGSDDYWIVKLKPDNILPVTNLILTGKVKGKQNLLQWTTITEKNNTGFEVQRSNDGYNFSKIGFVNTKATNGHSNSKLSYDFLDIASAAFPNYYRLKQIDTDGKSAYSNIVLIRNENIPATGDITVYPNPAKNILNIEISLTDDSNVRLSVTDMAGKIILGKSITAAKGENIIQLDISPLSAGSYLIKTVFENGRKAEKKFVKE